MQQITDELTEQYVYSLLPGRDAVLVEMEAEAQRRSIPIVGAVVGRFLYQLARMIGAKRIFEMGSAIGYSTVWLARAVGSDGKVYYCDASRTNADQAARYFERAGVSAQVEILVGDAIELLGAARGQFDLIFNDIDKSQYPQAFHTAVSRIRSGGLFVTDNVLWSGRVARDDREPATKAIREFNRLIYASGQLYPVIVPMRDGLAICLKS